MHYAKVGTTDFLIRLERGEEINASVKVFCEREKIKNASFFGIGSVEKATLAHYTVEGKRYRERLFSGRFELVSLIGTVGMFEGKPLVHSHATISDERMETFGGHLVEGVTHATVEVVLWTFRSKYGKKYSDAIGLRLFELPESL